MNHRNEKLRAIRNSIESINKILNNSEKYALTGNEKNFYRNKIISLEKERDSLLGDVLDG